MRKRDNWQGLSQRDEEKKKIEILFFLECHQIFPSWFSSTSTSFIVETPIVVDEGDGKENENEFNLKAGDGKLP